MDPENPAVNQSPPSEEKRVTITDPHAIYQSPLSGRYASEEMKHLFSDNWKYTFWRKMWHAIAKSMHDLGISNITKEQLLDMEAHFDDINYEAVAKIEKKTKHDVVAHSTEFGNVAKIAAPIIHWGCTSCDITDNVDLVQIKKASCLIRDKIAQVLIAMKLPIKEEYRDLIIMGETHWQKAQPTTLAHRMAMWAQPLLFILEELIDFIDWLPFRGIKGPVGTQASFMKIFKNDYMAVKAFELAVAHQFGFRRVLTITGQTYDRYIDSRFISILSRLGAILHKIGLDLRFMQSKKEVEESFEKEQKGSSAMPKKKNPMKAERMCSLARVLIGKILNALSTQSVQGQERTLDDSAERRIDIPESFLLSDAILILLLTIIQGLVVYPKTFEKEVEEELPMIAMEGIMASMVEHGASETECHTKLRDIAQDVQTRIYRDGDKDNTLELITNDDYFKPIISELPEIMNPKNFIGAAPQQTDWFVDKELDLVLEKLDVKPSEKIELKV